MLGGDFNMLPHDEPMSMFYGRAAGGYGVFAEADGTEGGARYSTKEPKTLWLFEGGKEQYWKKTDLGFGTPFKTVTGGIFEPGFPDVIQQMWAAFLMEREGLLEARFGCATPEEAVQSQRLFAAALESHKRGQLSYLR